MLVFPGMIVDAAIAAGIKVPDDLENYEKSEFPHWHVFQSVQLGSPMPFPQAHFANAEIVASISKEEIKTVTLNQLIERGLRVGYSYHVAGM